MKTKLFNISTLYFVLCPLILCLLLYIDTFYINILTLNNNITNMGNKGCCMIQHGENDKVVQEIIDYRDDLGNQITTIYDGPICNGKRSGKGQLNIFFHRGQENDSDVIYYYDGFWKNNRKNGEGREIVYKKGSHTILNAVMQRDMDIYSDLYRMHPRATAIGYDGFCDHNGMKMYTDECHMCRRLYYRPNGYFFKYEDDKIEDMIKHKFRCNCQMGKSYVKKMEYEINITESDTETETNTDTDNDT